MPHTARTRSNRRPLRYAMALAACAALAGGAAAVRAARTTPGGAIPERAVTLPTADAPAPIQPVEGMTQAVGAAAAPARPFDHAVHDRLLCTACHGSGEQHRTLRVRTPRDCAACHHTDDGERTCQDCHAPPALPEPGTLAVVVNLSTAPEPRRRQLPFGHLLHETVACRDCHSAPVTLAMERTCGSCHESHHAADRDCSACHQPPMQPVHDAPVHLTCAGVACHAAARAPRAGASRTLCVVCHAAQQDHEAGAACASCHLLLVEEGGS